MSRTRRRRRIYLLILLFCFFLLLNLLQSPWVGRYFYPLDYREEIEHYAAANNLDPLLVAAIIYVESGYNPRAISPKGARGLMQIMPPTAAWIAESLGIENYAPERLFEPRFNIRLGTWYLANLLAEFEQDRFKALAAYNGGRGTVREWLDSGIWDGNGANLVSIPYPETRDYVARVEKAYNRYRFFYRRW